MEKKDKGHEDTYIERERWRRKKRDMKIDRERERDGEEG